MTDRETTYTQFRRIERLTDLYGLCVIENEAAFVTLQNFGRGAYGMFWSTEDMLLREDIPEFAVWTKVTVPHLGSAKGYDVMAYVWYEHINEFTIVKLCAIEDETLDRIAELEL